MTSGCPAQCLPTDVLVSIAQPHRPLIIGERSLSRSLDRQTGEAGRRYNDKSSERRRVIAIDPASGLARAVITEEGAVKQQITKGEWVVRSVVKVDEETRTIYFAASGMDAGRDPYFVRYYRINIDGTGLLPLTPADAQYSVLNRAAEASPALI